MSHSLPLVEELVPAPDPWDVAHKLAHLPHLLFLDSADRDSPLGRYSYVAADPAEWIELDAAVCPDPLATLARRLPTTPSPTVPDLPPFQGGFAGLFGHGLCHTLERIARPRFDEFCVPDLAVGRYDRVYSFDHVTRRAWCIGRARSRERPVSFGVEKTRGAHATPLASQHPVPGFPNVTSTFDRPGFEAAVRRVVEYIRAGDC